MADKSIGELPVSPGMTDDALLVVYQNGETQSIEGGLIKGYARESTEQYVEGAKQSAEDAAESAEAAEAARAGVEEYEAKAKASADAAAISLEEAQASAALADAAKADVEANAAKAATAAGNAKSSETASKTSETAAGKSATDADSAKRAAQAAQTAAEAAKAGAEGSAAAAENSATAASGSATGAGGSATAAAGSATAAEQARQAIEALGVQGTTLPAGSDVAVEKIVDEGGAVTLKFSIPQGIKGDTGETGAQGVSIAKIERTGGTGAAGTTDTYTITLSDGTSSTFQVYNGKDGEGVGDMLSSTYDPQGKGEDVFAYADEAERKAKEASRPSTWTPTAADVGAVPTARKVNGKPLTSDITLTAGDVGALPTTGGTMTGWVNFSGPAGQNSGIIEFRDGTLWLKSEIGVKIGTGGEQPLVVSGVETPRTNTDAANKGYVDEKVLVFKNVDVPYHFWHSDTTHSNSGFGWRAKIICPGVTVDYRPDVVFQLDFAMLGVLAPIAESCDGGVYIYCKNDLGYNMTIPSIVCVKGA